jgi:DNA-binding MarR family transcriptional regulator
VSRWSDLGFRGSPYQTTPIPGTAEGERLLVGRDAELEHLGTLLESSARHITVEGANGIGKTSLVAVAGYRARRAFMEGTTRQLLIPLDTTFQLTSNQVAEFEADLYRRIARAFIDFADALRDAGRPVPDTKDVQIWLDAPLLRGGGAGGSFLGMGGNFSRSAAANSAGFAEAGLPHSIREWLSQAFPSRESGAFICVIDNLELIDTSQIARQTLESLRDTVFALPGLRWVLCGARGIIRSAASSTRLQGVLTEPIELEPVSDDLAMEVLVRRIDALAVRKNAIAPVGAEAFAWVYRIVGSNLRNALKFSEDFALRPGGHLIKGSERERRVELQAWMEATAKKHLDDATSIKPRSWTVFDRLVERGGLTSPSEYDSFGFASTESMRPHVRSLEEAQLVASTVDESDQRRKTISLTPKGWLVNYARSGFKPPLV